MNKAILIKKLQEEQIIYTMTEKQLTIQYGEFGIISITLDSDYYLFHKIFKMLDEIKEFK